MCRTDQSSAAHSVTHGYSLPNRQQPANDQVTQLPGAKEP